MAQKAKNGGANLRFEAQLWATANKLRGSMEPSDLQDRIRADLTRIPV